MSSLKKAYSVYYEKGGLVKALLALLYNPSVRATFLMHHCAKSSGATYWFLRNVLISMHSIDIGKGARITYPNLPHPMGIVIGKGVIVEENVTLYHNVTLGAKNGGYPHIKSGVTIFPSATVVGLTVVNEAAMIGANCFLDRSLAEKEVFSGHQCVPAQR